MLSNTFHFTLNFKQLNEMRYFYNEDEVYISGKY